MIQSCGDGAFLSLQEDSMKRRDLLSLGGSSLAAALIFTGFGCNGGKTEGETNAGTGGSPSGKTIELTFWHTQTQENKTALEQLCKDFNEKNGKGVMVRPLWQGDYTQLYNKLMASVVGHR